jgi:hypothetical protein
MLDKEKKKEESLQRRSMEREARSQLKDEKKRQVKTKQQK